MQKKRSYKVSSKSFFVAHKHARWLLPLLAILILVFFAFRNISDPKMSEESIGSSDNKQYVSNTGGYNNSMYKYRLSYPKEQWSIEATLTSREVVIRSNEQFGPEIEPVVYTIQIFADADPIEKIQDKQIYPYARIEKTTINGYTAYRIEGIPSRGGTLDYLFTKDGRTFVNVSLNPFSSESPYPQQERFRKNFEQILSTFEFTD